MSYTIKPIIEKKFWIVESNGQKYGTLRTLDESTFEFATNGELTVINETNLFAQYGIDVANSKSNTVLEPVVTRNTEYKHMDMLYGFPVASEPYNSIFDVQKKLPMYTKTDKSNSFHCAGYYVIQYENGWSRAFCPKIVTLSKYEHFGPYKTKEDMLAKLRLINR